MPCHDGEIMYKSNIKSWFSGRITFSCFIFINAKRLAISSVIIMAMFCIPCFTDDTPQVARMPAPVLKKAVLCEKIVSKNKPVYEGVVFSSGLGRIICFNDFDPVYEETFIFHKFYFNDKLSKEFRLTIKPPRWETYSSIQLRESDKGPWRVEITDADDNVLHTIRFSITD